ncbi:hypothetical protein [Streptomyces sp. NPDC093225]|uniref:hypothetical protein n=1 Tax=Streptomyces sp. NPDC093225 TaxID=3366034 RepID=UPI0038041821
MPNITFEQETARRTTAAAGPLGEFTSGLAPRLSSAWTSRVHSTPYRWSQADYRLWEREDGALWQAVYHSRQDSDHLRARAFLTHPTGLQLYIVQRPYRPSEFLVGALLPAGIFEYDTTPHPSAIAVPADPARAAAAIRRRLLPYYRTAAMRVSRSTRFRQTQKVVIGQSAEGIPIADVLSPRAVRALLHEDERWYLDPGTGLCAAITPSPHSPDDLVQDAAARLRGLAFEVVLTTEHPLDLYFRPSPPAAPTPVAVPPPTTSRPARR